MNDISILSEERCALGEGPFYCARRDTLFWFDILGAKRHAHNFANSTNSVENLPEMASAMAVVDDAHDLIFTQSGLWSLEISTGAWSPVASIEADNDITRSNDARVHPSGAFWIGTMGLKAEDKAGAIYHFREGTLTTLFADITIPNAICFSPDGTAAYFTDTLTARLMRVLTDPETGLPEGEPAVLVDHTNALGGLDGAIVDADGNIWIALWGASCVNCYAPDGALIKSIAVPASQPSCPAFVGGGKIAVTSALQGLDEAAQKADLHAGKTFLIDAKAQPKFEPRVSI